MFEKTFKAVKEVMVSHQVENGGVRFHITPKGTFRVQAEMIVYEFEGIYEAAIKFVELQNSFEQLCKDYSPAIFDMV